MNQKVIIIGAGGHGKVIADIITCAGDHVLGFLDDKAQGTHAGFPVLGKSADWIQYPNARFIIAIGNATVRERIADSMQGVVWHTAVHPAAVVSEMETSIGEGTVIMANAVINPGASIGCHCIINTGAVVEHDNVIEDYVHLSVGAKTGGTCRVGRSTWVGIGAAVSNNITICPMAYLGAGAVVVKDITEPGTYVGVPVRKIK